jgi:hypothetical protein
VAPRASPVRRLLPIGLVAIALAGCGGDDDATKSSTARTSTPEAPTGPSTSTTQSPSDSTPRPPSDSGPSSNSNTQPPNTQPPPKGGSGGAPVGSVPSRSGSAADRKAVVRTVRTYLVSIAKGDGDQACAQLTPGARRRLLRKLAEFAPETAGAPCAGVILLYQGAYGDAIRDPRITGVRVRGNRARAIGPIHQVAHLVKAGRLWLIAAYGQ